jgi:phage recombination protein Bet
MSNITTIRAETPVALTMPEADLLAVLRTSLYPGAQDQSIRMVLGYCRAAGLDPMMKPVHIVPMWDGKAKEMRDVIMPGVGLYRTQAARSGELAGIGEPVFGDLMELTLGGSKITVPEWCSVTVKRLVGGAERDFTAREYWVENYATKGRDSLAPNAMWAKRPRGQLAKCAQAQALRMAFPEMTGAQPTADEMEGKFEEGEPQAAPMVEVVPKPPATYSQADFDKNLPTWRKAIEAGKKTADQIIVMVESKAPLSDEQKATIRAAAAPKKPDAPEVSYAQVMDSLVAAQKAGDIEKLNEAGLLIGAVEGDGLRAELAQKYNAMREEMAGEAV